MDKVELTIVVPAAGQGRRMKGHGLKAMIPLNANESLLERQLKIFQKTHHGSDVVVVAGYEAERIAAALPARVRFVENELYEQTNVARSILLAIRASRCDSVLVVYSDLAFSPSTLDALPTEDSFVLVDSRGRFSETEVGLTVEGDYVAHFSYGLPTKWCQVVYLTGRELRLFRRIASQPSKRKHFTFEILNDIIEQDGCFLAIEPSGMKIIEVDTAADIEKAQKMFKKCLS